MFPGGFAFGAPPSLPLTGGTMTGDIALDGNKLIMDSDEDTYFQSTGDDLVKLVTGGDESIEFNDARTIFSKDLRLNDDVPIVYGTSGDAAEMWDTAETNPRLKLGLPASGVSFVVGPIADLGADTYGASVTPYGLTLKEDSATATNRADLSQGGSIFTIASRHASGQVKFTGGAQNLLVLATTGMTINQKMVIQGVDLQLHASIGTEIGTAPTQEMSFWGATPIEQPAHIADPAGGATVDAEARTAINAINAALAASGQTAAA